MTETYNTRELIKAERRDEYEPSFGDLLSVALDQSAIWMFASVVLYLVARDSHAIAGQLGANGFVASAAIYAGGVVALIIYIAGRWWRA